MNEAEPRGPQPGRSDTTATGSRFVKGWMLGLVLTLVLGTIAVATAARIVTLVAPGFDLSSTQRFQLGDDARERLGDLSHRVVVTWFATPPDEMPSHLRGLDREVREVLSALARDAHGQLTWQVVDPRSSDELGELATRLGIEPFTTRDVRGDAWNERTVWSSLHLSYGPYPPAVIHSLGAEGVRDLSGRILAHLQQMERPRRPVVALDAPPEYRDLRQAIAARAELVEHPFSNKPPTPEDVDLFVWIDPARRSGDAPALDATHAELVEELLERGKSVLIAGGELELRDDGAGAPTLAPIGQELDPLLAGLGLRPVPGLVLDERSLATEERVRLPFLLLCNAYDQDFRTLRGQPNGTLLFDLPLGFQFDAPRLAELGLRPETLATTSDRTWTQDVPSGSLQLDALAPENGTVAPKLPVLVRLVPRHPDRGSLIVCGTTSPFRGFEDTRLVHRQLVDVLLDDRLSNERLVAIAAPRSTPERLPFLSSPARLTLRALTIALVPGVLAILAFVRGRWRRSAGRQGTAGRAALPSGPLVRRAVPALLLTLVFAGLAGMALPRVDLTADGRNSLSPITYRLAAEAGEVRVRRVVSRNDRLPPSLRATARAADRLLSELARAPGVELVVERLDPELLSPAEQQELERIGAGPVEIASRSEESRVVRRVQASLVLEPDERHTGSPVVVSLHDPDALDELEFRLALALRSLDRGRPRIGFASDLPRMTAAEAWEYQASGLFAPLGTDEYALARERLERSGFEVVHVNPRAPEIPPELAALVWLQPRRDVVPMLGAAIDHLSGGGALLLAAQHFTIEAEADEDETNEPSFLPRDQLPDLDQLDGYLPGLGIELVRELVFDRSEARLTQATAAARDDEPFAQPFLVGVPAETFDATAVATRTQSDQVFVAPSAIALDVARLAELGLRARAWISTSDRAWTSTWAGGPLTAETLAGENAAPRSLPLVVAVEGSFPARGAEQVATSDGTLVLIGCSEMFKDRRLRAQEARGDRLLVDTVASLALDEELAAVVAGRPVARGFEPVHVEERLRWRGLVTAGIPLTLLLVALVRAFARSRT